MGQNFCSAQELDHMLAEMKVHQRRDVLLCIDEILTGMDMTRPAAAQWTVARKTVQFIEDTPR